jgi:PucR C-terminal helix-turn-helix domain
MSAELPPSLAAALRPALPDLSDAIIAAIGAEVPAYARPLEGPFGRAVRIGVRTALARFVDGIEDPASEDPDARRLYAELGRAEFRGGRSLDALLSAYRIGARLAWERFVAAGEAAGHEPATLYRLASAIFSYIDGISADSVEGYAQERAETEGERQRRRRALARLLARDDVSVEEVHDLARLAGWARPATVAALVVGGTVRTASNGDPGDGAGGVSGGGGDAGGGDAAPGDAAAGGAAEPLDPDRLASRLGGDAIAAGDGPMTVAWLPDPEAPGRRAQLEAALEGTPAALGPAVALPRAAHSLARARTAHALLLEGRLPGDAIVAADDHLAELLLHGGDTTLAADLAARVLAPLHEVRPKTAVRLRETLRAWLDHPGQVQAVAERLHVHPQTVRYRVAQLRELFGDALEDPDARFELALALRSEPAAPAAG